MFASIPLSKLFSPLGDHQRIDRLAHRYMRKHLDISQFPGIKAILANEGRKGPDGAKYQSELVEEKHFYYPETNGAELLTIINKHYDALVKALGDKDDKRAATAASWLAHAAVDGLTPAHQFPYPDALETLTCDTEHVRDTAGKRFYIKGETVSDSIVKTWRLTGPRGLLTSHTLFETSMAIALQHFRPRLKLHLPTSENEGIDELFLRHARKINSLDLYDKFTKSGPTPAISLQLRRIVGPAMVEVVTLLWSRALQEATQ